MDYVPYALGAGVVGLIFAAILAKKVMSKDRGNDLMKTIQGHIQEGAMAFLKREYRTLAIFVLAIAVILLFGLQSESIATLGLKTAIAFIVGAVLSSLCGFLGMRIATAANARTTAAAMRSFNEALGVAFPGGVVMGMLVMSLGIIGISSLFLVFKGTEGGDVANAATIIAGFSMGASSIALFARVGGGIYTKAADVGADLVGKVEAGIPEDDPRNPATIADNVGDNVGDVAGMGADLFESFVGAILSAVVIAMSTLTVANGFAASVPSAAIGFVFSVLAAGVLASILGVFAVRVKEGGDPQKALRQGTIMSAVLFAVFVFALALGVFGNTEGVNTLHWALAVLTGLAAGLCIGFTAEHYTSGKVVEMLAEQSDTQPTNIIAGLAIGFRSAVLPLIIIAAAVVIAYLLGGMFGVTLAAVGMLGTLGITVGVDAYGPIADNAGGIAEMAHLPPEVRERTDSLDSAGNTTAAIAKGFAIGSAALTALALFTAYQEAVRLLVADKGWVTTLDIADPIVLAGLLLGGVIPFMFSADTMKAVGTAAQQVIHEVQRQFREVPGLKEGKEGAVADYARCVDITTQSSLREMIRPGLMAVMIPIIVGCFLGPTALGGLLAGSLIAGVPLAIMLANAGGAWDNAKKYIEASGGKGTERHKHAVVGDTVGDPFKDTSGPSINILLKLMAVISLVFAPLTVWAFQQMPWTESLIKVVEKAVN